MPDPVRRVKLGFASGGRSFCWRTGTGPVSLFAFSHFLFFGFCFFSFSLFRFFLGKIFFGVAGWGKNIYWGWCVRHVTVLMAHHYISVYRKIYYNSPILPDTSISIQPTPFQLLIFYLFHPCNTIPINHFKLQIPKTAF